MNAFLAPAKPDASPLSSAADVPQVFRPDESAADSSPWLQFLHRYGNWILLAIFCAAAGTLVYRELSRAILAARMSANDCAAIHQARQMAWGMINHEIDARHWPAAHSASPSGKPLLSWRVHMLPYLEQKELFAQFHLDEPWDSPHNRQLIERRPACYASPGRTLPPGLTPWLAIVGRHAVVGDPFLCDKKWSLEGIRDGMIADPRDATGLLLEADDASLVIWTKPDDYETDRKSLRENFYWRTAGCILAFADGHVARTPHDTPDAKLQAMFTRSGQEEVAGKILDPEW